MITVTDIQKLISAYLKNADLESFNVKFAELFYDIEHTGDPSAVQFSYEVESMLAAVITGMMSEKQFTNVLHYSVPANSFATLSFGEPVTVNQQVGFASLEATVHGHIKFSAGFGLATVPLGTPQANIILAPSQQDLVA